MSGIHPKPQRFFNFGDFFKSGSDNATSGPPCSNVTATTGESWVARAAAIVSDHSPIVANFSVYVILGLVGIVFIVGLGAGYALYALCERRKRRRQPAKHQRGAEAGRNLCPQATPAKVHASEGDHAGNRGPPGLGQHSSNQFQSATSVLPPSAESLPRASAAAKFATGVVHEPTERERLAGFRPPSVPTVSGVAGKADKPERLRKPGEDDDDFVNLYPDFNDGDDLLRRFIESYAMKLDNEIRGGGGRP